MAADVDIEGGPTLGALGGIFETQCKIMENGQWTMDNGQCGEKNKKLE